MPVNNMSEDGHWDFREHNLFKFGKILSTNELREIEQYYDRVKEGTHGVAYVDEGVSVVPIFSDNIKYLKFGTPGVDDIDHIFPEEDPDVEITNIMDGTGRIVCQLRQNPREQERIYHEALAALKEYKPEPPPFNPDPLLIDPPEFDYAEPKHYKNYILYETAERIAKKWDDDSLIGHCEYCGMVDSPIVISREDNSDTKAKCKWCAELDNLTWHIKYNGGHGYEPLGWGIPWIKIAYITTALCFVFVMVFSAIGLFTTSPGLILIVGSIIGALGVINGKRDDGPVD